MTLINTDDIIYSNQTYHYWVKNNQVFRGKRKSGSTRIRSKSSVHPHTLDKITEVLSTDNPEKERALDKHGVKFFVSVTPGVKRYVKMGYKTKKSETG